MSDEKKPLNPSVLDDVFSHTGYAPSRFHSADTDRLIYFLTRKINGVSHGVLGELPFGLTDDEARARICHEITNSLFEIAAPSLGRVPQNDMWNDPWLHRRIAERIDLRRAGLRRKAKRRAKAKG